MPVDFRIRTKSGKIDTLFWVDDRHEEFQVSLSDSVLIVELDPDEWILCKKTLVETGVEESAPTVFFLEQNYPNPFNTMTTIPFPLPESGRVTIEVYSILGQHVATILDEYMSAGYHCIVFKADNISSGIYLYTIKAGRFTETKQMMYLK